jgi:Rps23 Pro-64 3,4-dihydroxylase Tpa1-like proline 4-hydroxylase
VINEALELMRWRSVLGNRGRIQVDDYLQPMAAERLRDCLLHDVPWTLALRDGLGSRTIDHSTYAAMSEDAVAHLLAETAAGRSDGSSDEFRFAYDSYMMVRAYQEGRDPELLLHRVLEFFNSPVYLDFLRHLTGDVRIRRVNAQATRYRPGHFLRQHTDEELSEGRLYAYVLNLTPQWRADWGGLLQFIDPDGRVTETFLPRWNTLSLFAVPAGHAVSLVAPWARGDRLAITGWLLT